MSRFFRKLREKTGNFIRFVIGAALLVFAVLFVLGGGLQRLGLGRLRPNLSGVSGAANQQQAALTDQLGTMGIKTIYGTAQGNAVKVTLQWSGSTTRGGEALAAMQQRRLIRAFQPEGPNNIDVRNINGQQVYIGRYSVIF